MAKSIERSIRHRPARRVVQRSSRWTTDPAAGLSATIGDSPLASFAEPRANLPVSTGKSDEISGAELPASDGEEVQQPDREAFERRYMAELGRRLRTAREQRGMTQKQAAEAAGIATDMISRLENGHYQSPGLRTLLRIADGLGTGVAELLPELGIEAQASPVELSQRARLAALTHRADPRDLELIVEIAGTIVNRRR